MLMFVALAVMVSLGSILCVLCIDWDKIAISHNNKARELAQPIIHHSWAHLDPKSELMVQINNLEEFITLSEKKRAELVKNKRSSERALCRKELYKLTKEMFDLEEKILSTQFIYAPPP